MNSPAPINKEAGHGAIQKFLEARTYGDYSPGSDGSDHVILEQSEVAELSSLIDSYAQALVAEARIEENRYYAKLLKVNEKMTVQAALDGYKPTPISLRKIFEYRLAQLSQTNPSSNTEEAK